MQSDDDKGMVGTTEHAMEDIGMVPFSGAFRVGRFSLDAGSVAHEIGLSCKLSAKTIV